MNNKRSTLCPICGQHKFPDDGDELNRCRHCGWVHDAVSEDDPLHAWGSNDCSMNDHKHRYEYYMKNVPDYHWAKDGFPVVPQVTPMECPICNKYRFVPLTWDELDSGDKPSDSYCPRCGWHFDIDQVENPNLQGGANAMSLKEYSEWYKTKIESDPDYDYFEVATESYVPNPHKCPICGKYEFEDECCFDICPWCGWEDDGTEDAGTLKGANDLCFDEYKKRYLKMISENPRYKWSKE